MRKRTILLAVFSYISISGLIIGCKKQDDWLNMKRAKSDVTPTTLKDVQALLNNDDIMNAEYPVFGLISADNNIIIDDNLSRITNPERNAYTWQKDIYEGTNDLEWIAAYQMVGFSNIALEALDNIKPAANELVIHAGLKGAALFFRSMAFYNIAQLYCPQYEAANATTTPGIILRLTTDVNEPSTRATVQQTYDRIIEDLKIAETLSLDAQQYLTQPTNIAASALLARVFLNMGQYDSALVYANNVLNKKSDLLDFSSPTVDYTSTYRFPDFYSGGNPEIIFFAKSGRYSSIRPIPSRYGYTDSALYASYASNDLRKPVFYQETPGIKVKFQGNYTGSTENFSGLATNEVFLIRSECFARLGDIDRAMQDLNKLLRMRYPKDGSFSDYSAATKEEALNIILQERRKELPYTGQIRWEDLRRLNLDPTFARTLYRVVNGIEYTLAPKDKRYVLPIPNIEISNYNLEQNPR